MRNENKGESYAVLSPLRKPDATTEERHMMKKQRNSFPEKRQSIHQAQVKPSQSKDISVTYSLWN
jgi:hypothetical protein